MFTSRSKQTDAPLFSIWVHAQSLGNYALVINEQMTLIALNKANLQRKTDAKSVWITH